MLVSATEECIGGAHRRVHAACNDRRMQQLITDHQGPLYVLYRSNEDKESRAALQHFNLRINEKACQQMNPHIENRITDPFYFCAVTPMDSYTQNERNTK